MSAEGRHVFPKVDAHPSETWIHWVVDASGSEVDEGGLRQVERFTHGRARHDSVLRSRATGFAERLFCAHAQGGFWSLARFTSRDLRHLFVKGRSWTSYSTARRRCQTHTHTHTHTVSRGHAARVFKQRVLVQASVRLQVSKRVELHTRHHAGGVRNHVLNEDRCRVAGA